MVLLNANRPSIRRPSGQVKQDSRRVHHTTASVLELGRYLFSFFWSVFQESVSVTVSVFQNIAISVSVFGFSARTYHCLSNNTIADTLRPPLSPNGVWALEFALQIAAIRDSDIVTRSRYSNLDLKHICSFPSLLLN